jgi:hypothetical protein
MTRLASANCKAALARFGPWALAALPLSCGAHEGGVWPPSVFQSSALADAGAATWLCVLAEWRQVQYAITSALAAGVPVSSSPGVCSAYDASIYLRAFIDEHFAPLGIKETPGKAAPLLAGAQARNHRIAATSATASSAVASASMFDADEGEDDEDEGIIDLTPGGSSSAVPTPGRVGGVGSLLAAARTEPGEASAYLSAITAAEAAPLPEWEALPPYARALISGDTVAVSTALRKLCQALMRLKPPSRRRVAHEAHAAEDSGRSSSSDDDADSEESSSGSSGSEEGTGQERRGGGADPLIAAFSRAKYHAAVQTAPLLVRGAVARKGSLSRLLLEGATEPVLAALALAAFAATSHAPLAPPASQPADAGRGTIEAASRRAEQAALRNAGDRGLLWRGIMGLRLPPRGLGATGSGQLQKQHGGSTTSHRGQGFHSTSARTRAVAIAEDALLWLCIRRHCYHLVIRRRNERAGKPTGAGHAIRTAFLPHKTMESLVYRIHASRKKQRLAAATGSSTEKPSSALLAFADVADASSGLAALASDVDMEDGHQSHVATDAEVNTIAAGSAREPRRRIRRPKAPQQRDWLVAEACDAADRLALLVSTAPDSAAFAGACVNLDVSAAELMVAAAAAAAYGSVDAAASLLLLPHRGTETVRLLAALWSVRRCGLVKGAARVRGSAAAALLHASADDAAPAPFAAAGLVGQQTAAVPASGEEEAADGPSVVGTAAAAPAPEQASPPPLPADMQMPASRSAFPELFLGSGSSTAGSSRGSLDLAGWGALERRGVTYSDSQAARSRRAAAAAVVAAATAEEGASEGTAVTAGASAPSDPMSVSYLAAVARLVPPEDAQVAIMMAAVAQQWAEAASNRIAQGRGGSDGLAGSSGSGFFASDTDGIENGGGGGGGSIGGIPGLSAAAAGALMEAFAPHAAASAAAAAPAPAGASASGTWHSASDHRHADMSHAAAGASLQSGSVPSGGRGSSIAQFGQLAQWVKAAAAAAAATAAAADGIPPVSPASIPLASTGAHAKSTPAIAAASSAAVVNSSPKGARQKLPLRQHGDPSNAVIPSAAAFTSAAATAASAAKRRRDVGASGVGAQSSPARSRRKQRQPKRRRTIGTDSDSSDAATGVAAAASSSGGSGVLALVAAAAEADAAAESGVVGPSQAAASAASDLLLTFARGPSRMDDSVSL